MLTIPQVAVVPLKPFADAKLRLRDAMSSERRQALAHRMATHVVTTAMQVLPTAVVSRDHDVLAFAESLGAYPVPEAPRPGLRIGGLNDALYDAARWAEDRKAKALVVVAGDLPFLAPDDVTAMLRFPGRPGIVIAPDTSRTGTNALALMPPSATEFRFGVGSLRRHRSAAYLSNVPLRIVMRAGLSRDIDTVEDLEQARTSSTLSVIDRMLFQSDVAMASIAAPDPGVEPPGAPPEAAHPTRAETGADADGIGSLGKRRRKTGGKS